jgi:hypothetical protein
MIDMTDEDENMNMEEESTTEETSEQKVEDKQKVKKQRGRKSERSAEESAALRVKRTFLYGFRTTLKKDGFEEVSSKDGVYVLQRGDVTITCYLNKDKVDIQFK